jgi:predicted  nucleic acid-binding Zn-ribbon protein
MRYLRRSILGRSCVAFSPDLQGAKNSDEFLKLKKELESEKLKKTQAVNKLAEIMNRKEFREKSKGKEKASSADLKKKEKDLRRAQQELTMVRILRDMLFVALTVYSNGNSLILA